jgi:hypothetical protein
MYCLKLEGTLPQGGHVLTVFHSPSRPRFAGESAALLPGDVPTFGAPQQYAQRQTDTERLRLIRRGCSNVNESAAVSTGTAQSAPPRHGKHQEQKVLGKRAGSILPDFRCCNPMR